MVLLTKDIVRFHLACASVRKQLLREARQSCRDISLLDGSGTSYSQSTLRSNEFTYENDMCVNTY
jgi:hypothetical protein